MYNIIIKCVIYLCKCARKAAIYGFNFLCKVLGIGLIPAIFWMEIFKAELYRKWVCARNKQIVSKYSHVILMES